MRRESESELEKVKADCAWWQRAGKVLGLELFGWTFRNHASFVAPGHRGVVEMPGFLGERLNALQDKLEGKAK